MWNTPATLNIWTTGKLARWMEAEGGLEEMERRAAAKAAAVYGAIDGSGGFFGTPVANEGERSRMNVPFNVAGSTNILRVAPCDERMIYYMDPGE